jgi:spermidine/putrescine transport system ATP-binding protein
MSASLLTLERLEKRYGSIAAVAGIDLEIGEGEFVALMGPSGCGKTTTLRMIAGLETPSAGEIRLRGRRMNEVSPWQRDVADPGALPVPRRTAQRRIRAEDARRRQGGKAAQGDGVAGAPGDRRAGAALDRPGLGWAAAAGGAGALVVAPPVLLLDEPLTALDANLVVRMQAELTQLQKSLGITFIYVTHSQSEAFAMANRVVIMNEGRIVQVGAPREIYRTPASRFVAEFVGANNIMAGRVSTADGSGLVAETPAGTFQAVARPGMRLAAGDTVILVVSADRVVLSDQPAAQENRLSGTILSEEFIGAVVTLHLDIGNGAVFRVQKQQRELDTLDLARGRVLHVGWSAADTYVLPQEKRP